MRLEVRPGGSRKCHALTRTISISVDDPMGDSARSWASSEDAVFQPGHPSNLRYQKKKNTGRKIDTEATFRTGGTVITALLSGADGVSSQYRRDM